MVTAHHPSCTSQMAFVGFGARWQHVLDGIEILKEVMGIKLFNK
jgi:hypothetical protein